MTTGDGWTSRLLTGLAEQLDTAGIGTWRPASAYTADEVGILIRAIPTSPDRIITLAAYPVSAEVGLAEITTGVQVRVRGTTDPRICDDLADTVFDELDSAAHLNWGGIPVAQVYRQSYASLGTDTAGRWQASHNYYVDAMRATPNRTD